VEPSVGGAETNPLIRELDVHWRGEGDRSSANPTSIASDLLVNDKIAIELHDEP
jgi:hypothetical protein